MKHLLSIFFVACSVLSGFSQISVGEWRDHFSYRQVHSIAESPDGIFAASELALFIYDKSDFSVSKLSKVNGLSDAGISHIAYNTSSNLLMIAYVNSNIDVVKDGRVLNFSEIKRKQISGNKNINRIIMIDEKAYLACGFGIVEFDTEKLEFTDTYIIGEDASYLNVNDVAMDNRYMYAATESGLYKADYTQSYLGDYKNWNKDLSIPNSNANVFFVEIFQNRLFCYQNTSLTSGGGSLYSFVNGNWLLFNSGFNSIRDIQSNEQNILFANYDLLTIYDTDFNVAQSINEYSLSDSVYQTTTMASACYNSNGDLLIGDQAFGLLIKKSGDAFTQILPDGPYNNDMGSVEIVNNKLLLTTGAIALPSSRRSIPGYYNFFEDEKWSPFFIPDILDLTRSAQSPINPDKYFLSSWGAGVLEFNLHEQTAHYTMDNSSLQSIIPSSPNIYTIVFDMEFDSNNNLWISNGLVPEPLSLLTATGEWFSYKLYFDGYQWVRNLLVRDDNTVWIDLYRNGLYAFDNNGTPGDLSDDRYRAFIPETGDDEEMESEVRAIAEDKNGTIWVGTIQGVFVYYDPDRVFDSEAFLADRIRVTEYGSDTVDQYLLKTEIITDIEVDGANRKWIGTQSSGVFLVSENGKTQIHHFDKFNSPLISNVIMDIEIDPKSGEVYVATDQGLMSFRGDATEADDYFDDVYVFPNPVRPEFTGEITVTGLAQDVNVKFTDVSGALVYETTALGGQAIWDGNRFDGTRVSSGVYLVFCTNADGSETFVTKLLFIN